MKTRNRILALLKGCPVPLTTKQIAVCLSISRAYTNILLRQIREQELATVDITKPPQCYALCYTIN